MNRYAKLFSAIVLLIGICTISIKENYKGKSEIGSSIKIVQGKEKKVVETRKYAKLEGGQHQIIDEKSDLLTNNQIRQILFRDSDISKVVNVKCNDQFCDISTLGDGNSQAMNAVAIIVAVQSGFKENELREIRLRVSKEYDSIITDKVGVHTVLEKI